MSVSLSLDVFLLLLEGGVEVVEEEEQQWLVRALEASSPSSHMWEWRWGSNRHLKRWRRRCGRRESTAADVCVCVCISICLCLCVYTETGRTSDTEGCCCISRLSCRLASESRRRRVMSELSFHVFLNFWPLFHLSLFPLFSLSVCLFIHAFFNV